ncbi:acyl-CoA dehydrogenase C-terminal domain-containing protein [Roseomonas sp. GC11]|uniref:acyl-CoA dehydrogenase C-terminal domain-containing protein n=1 Tax=Roseomonas sp. GC11 TaxID=2950546 RepID=UPI00210E1EF5|nr:acyl-CoA dehydrogenase C-terminal domain-containing protein [Roseomonas sp. GC11]MCQ4160186.1 acyl-CoA dehydrogenase C-terminal domain-containing protein [Roseomonas sp. GC11]
MPDYKPPVEDMISLLEEVLEAGPLLASLPGAEGDPLPLLRDVLSEAGRFTAGVLAPLNASGDAEGCRLENGVVRAPKGFAEAYAAFAADGWTSLTHPPEWGGQGLPQVAQIALDEMVSSANFAFGLLPGLTRGAVETIARYAPDALKPVYLPKLVSGTWTGAMALTEAHAGTDLGLLRTRAEPQPDGTLRVTGSKIFITVGDHEMAENIVHLVLVRLPDAPPGVRGISLALVPKYLPDAEGRPGPRNAMSVGALEHKMGIHGSPTCVMNYDGATGWLIGEPHRGLSAMFTMMNAERLFVGLQGLGVAEAAYQGAARYARERLQGRAPLAAGTGTAPAGQGPQPILGHPDVRRMLLTIRAFTGAGRALALWTALEMDKAAHLPEAAGRAAAEGLLALLTPVIKASFTDLGFEATVLAQQVLGGHGYVREWGMEQFVRDARIAQIYEGTNGVQAMDLVTRKLVMEEGLLPFRFFALVRQSIEAGAAIPGAADYTAPLAAALKRLEGATTRLQKRAAADPVEAGAAATDYLRFFALVALGWMWLRMALHALALGAAAEERHRDRLAVAQFFLRRILPQTVALDLAIAEGAAPLLALREEAY